MTKEELEQIRKEYTEEKRLIQSDFEEIKELEEHPVVKRYKYLLELQRSYIGVDNCYKDVISKLIKKFGSGALEQTNHIWFWAIDLSVQRYEEIFGSSYYDEDKERMVSVYMDLEDATRRITIPLSEQPTFEQENRVVRGKRFINDFQDRYYNTRYKFFDLCIEKGQDEAIKAMLEEERFWRNEVETAKRKELASLEDCLKYHLVSEDDYQSQRDKILIKK